MKGYNTKSKSKLSDLAGKWEMSGKEINESMKTLKKRMEKIQRG